jgi:hypothetical protein
MIQTKTQFLLLIGLGLSALSACASPAPIQTATIAPSAVPSITLQYVSTPTPRPTSAVIPALVAHSWKPQKVLISLGGSGGDGPQYPSLDDFTVYSDGQIFSLQWSTDATIQLMTARLPRKDLCALLNSIDQTGFFDYPSRSYVIDHKSKYTPMGAPSFKIEVNAWRRNAGNFYNLFEYVAQFDDTGGIQSTPCPTCEPIPTILPALRNTYRLLSTYKPANLQVYKPTALAIWVMSIRKGKDGKPWPLQSPKLSDLFLESAADTTSSGGTTIHLQGVAATKVFNAFDQSIASYGRDFTEGQYTFNVFAMPLLPGEFYSIPFEAPPLLTCTPSDGLVPIP